MLMTLGARRDVVLASVIVAAALALLAVLAVRMVSESGHTNSYALVAGSLLTAKPDVPTCFDGDCARADGRIYVVFPPLPGVVAMPLVAAFGTGTAGFIALGVLASALSLLVWSRILRRLELEPPLRACLLVAVAFASPLYYVTLRTEGVWFFAQAIAFPLVALAIERALAKKVFAAGCALAAALLCRQMSAFYAPLLLMIALPRDEPLLKIDRERVKLALLLAAPIAVAVLCYLSYNLWRFGNPLETGYRYIVFTDAEGMLKLRWDQYGPWNVAYLPYNLFYLLLQGFHAEFAAPERTRLAGLDNGGTSILAASPWLLFLFFTPLNRVTVGCGALILGLATALLFYHSNGFSQFNTQRYALDWLPAALLMLSLALRREHLGVLKLLVCWGMVLNVATVAILALTHGAG